MAIMMEIPKEGATFGRWTVMDKLRMGKHGHKEVACKCECGTKRWVGVSRLNKGLTKSCGCATKEQHAKFMKQYKEMPKSFTTA
jgi:hypothetical protein